VNTIVYRFVSEKAIWWFWNGDGVFYGSCWSSVSCKCHFVA